MKKLFIIMLSLIMIFSLSFCAKPKNRADTSLKEGEIILSGFVAESYGSSLLLQKAEGYDWGYNGADRVFLSFNDNIQFVEDGWYVIDLSPDSFEGKYISVICSQNISETYPAQLNGERMIIILD